MQAGYTFTCRYSMNDLVVGNDMAIVGAEKFVEQAEVNDGDIPFTFTVDDEAVVGTKVNFSFGSNLFTIEVQILELFCFFTLLFYSETYQLRVFPHPLKYS